MPPPHPFAPATYAAWHGTQFPGDDPLPEKVDKLRTEMMANSRGRLTSLALVLGYAADYSRVEYKQSAKTDTDYQISLADTLPPEASLPYELLFKSTASIINKLWRKNQDAPEVHLGNISEHITDLIRTDIAATTLSSAKFLAERMNAMPDIIHDPAARQEFNDVIESIRFGPEMKMASGYFAYHGLVRFKGGPVVEVQIYSDLMRQWRKLSHVLSERARVKAIEKHEFNSKESRLVSLGHLLHLAECELQQLLEDFGGH